jgi:hypothetical protein
MTVLADARSVTSHQETGVTSAAREFHNDFSEKNLCCRKSVMKADRTRSSPRCLAIDTELNRQIAAPVIQPSNPTVKT